MCPFDTYIIFAASYRYLAKKIQKVKRRITRKKSPEKKESGTKRKKAKLRKYVANLGKIHKNLFFKPFCLVGEHIHID